MAGALFADYGNRASCGRQGAVEGGWARPTPAGAVERMRGARKAQAAQFAPNVLPNQSQCGSGHLTSECVTLD